MAYSLDDYNTVPERIAEAKEKYPEGRFQSEVIELPPAFADKFIAVRATFYRTADDPTPAVGLAWEPVPGATNFTRQSELMNAETSAWGRALIAAFAADAKKGIASQEDIRNRQEEPKPRPRSGPQKRTPTPPETQENHKTLPVTDSSQVPLGLGPDVAAEVKRMKNWAFQQLGKDADKTKTIWEQVIGTFPLNAAGLPLADSIQFIESDLSIAVGEALTKEPVNP